jgi:hypothetical protein
LNTLKARAKWRAGAFALTLALASIMGGTAAAQDFTVGWNPRSGDVWVDTWLGDINRYGSRYRDPFIDELVRYHGAPRPLVLDLLDQRHWAPGDVYYACAMASLIGRPCRYVVDLYEADRGQGWGVIAQRLGIKPGSPEFHRLKKGFVPTYDRWARPIDLDDELLRDYPNRGKGPGSGKSVSSKVKSGDHGSAHRNNGGGPDKVDRGAGTGGGKPVKSRQGGGPTGQGSGKGQGSDKKGADKKGNSKG